MRGERGEPGRQRAGAADEDPNDDRAKIIIGDASRDAARSARRRGRGRRRKLPI